MVEERKDGAEISQADWDAAVAAMREAGRVAGGNAGSWVADGNTSDGALRVMLAGWESGDPAAPSAPSPFSGEWADGLTVEECVVASTELDAETCTPEELDELASAFEEEYSQAWAEEAERTVRGLLGDE